MGRLASKSLNPFHDRLGRMAVAVEQGPGLAGLSVDLAAVTDPYNEHDKFVLLPFIDDAVLTDP